MMEWGELKPILSAAVLPPAGRPGRVDVEVEIENALVAPAQQGQRRPLVSTTHRRERDDEIDVHAGERSKRRAASSVDATAGGPFGGNPGRSRDVVE